MLNLKPDKSNNAIIISKNDEINSKIVFKNSICGKLIMKGKIDIRYNWNLFISKEPMASWRSEKQFP